MHALKLAVAAALVAASVTAADACEGSRALFADQFTTALDPSWGTYGPELKVENGAMVIRPDPATVYWQTNDLADYQSVDACTDVVFLDSGVGDEVLAGLVFWYVDDDNFSVVQVDAAGHASFFQRIGGVWMETIPWAETPLVPQGDGKPVRLRVVARGSVGAIYIGDRKLTDVTPGMTLPPAGTKVGVIAGSATKSVSTIAFDNFALTLPN